MKYKWQIYDEDKMRQNYFNNVAENQMSNQIKMKVKIDGGDLFKNIKIININHLENFDKDKIELYVNGIKMEFQDYIYAIKKGTYDIKLIFKMEIKKCFEMFRMCHNIIEIDLSCFDTSKVTNMGYMFSNNDKLKKINLENIDTKNVMIWNACSESEIK